MFSFKNDSLLVESAWEGKTYLQLSCSIESSRESFKDVAGLLKEVAKSDLGLSIGIRGAQSLQLCD